MATVVRSFAIQGIDGYPVDIEVKMLEGQPVIRLSQIELADQYGSSPATVFAMLHTLQKAGCIQPYRRKSGYIVTGTGRAVIGRMEQIRALVERARTAPVS